MKRSIPLKLKLTTISVCILTVMCVAFAISTIYSTNGLVQATITTPAISVDESMPAITSEPSVAVTEALWQFIIRRENKTQRRRKKAALDDGKDG